MTAPRNQSKKTEKRPSLLRRILRYGFLAFLLLLTASAIASILMIRHFESQLPTVTDLSELRPAYGTSVRAQEGAFLGGEFAVAPVSYEELPPLLIMAFLAAEDEDFFRHRGYNTRSIFRAIFDNYRAGRTVQGASTITQQVAKHFVGDQRRVERKILELLLARKLEEEFSKEEILSAYLGGVYFGQQAWGVTMASYRYFQRHPAELTVGQMATLAGVLPGPSLFNPIDGPDRARRERNRVLRRLHEVGVLTAEQMSAEIEKPLEILNQGAPSPSIAPEAVGSVLRRWEELGQGRDWESSDLTVFTTHHLAAQSAARQSLQKGVEAHDRRIGYRAPIGQVQDEAAFDEAVKALNSSEFSLARVRARTSSGLEIQRGSHQEFLPAETLQWLGGAHPRTDAPRKRLSWRDAFQVGDVLLLRFSEQQWTLTQFPVHEGAVLVADHHSGETLASVGAYDIDASRFNRAEQACRQPGSLFKTILFAEALSRDVTLATLLSDVPTDVDSRSGVWQPRNADHDFRGYIIALDAFAASRNIPAVNLGQHVGHRDLIERARRFGIESVLDPTPSLALGASCLRVPEILAAHAAIPRGGLQLQIHSIAFIQNHRSGQIRDFGHFLQRDPSALRRVVRAASLPPAPPRAISSSVNHLLHQALRAVVASGTARAIPQDWPVSGKTGTSNDYDTWFVGFDPSITAAVWIGSDQNDRSFLSGEHGGTVALPVFIDFYAGREFPNHPWPPIPEEDREIEALRIDPRTGLRARPGEPGREILFLRSTAPRALAPTSATRQLERLDSLLH